MGFLYQREHNIYQLDYSYVMHTHPGGQSIPKPDYAGIYCIHMYVKIFANTVKVTISSMQSLTQDKKLA